MRAMALKMAFNVTDFVWDLPENFDDLKSVQKEKYLKEIDGFSRQPFYVQEDMTTVNKEWFQTSDFNQVDTVEMFWCVVQKQ